MSLEQQEPKTVLICPACEREYNIWSFSSRVPISLTCECGFKGIVALRTIHPNIGIPIE